MATQFSDLAEWLEADGLGGFASGTVCGRRTRRYHALLLAATTPPTGRMVLVNGFEAWLQAASGRYAISSQHYAPDVIHPDGQHRIHSFEHEPWPRWRFRLDDGTTIEQELFVPHGRAAVALRWRVLERGTDTGALTLTVRPLLSGRDCHALHYQNMSFRFAAHATGQRITWSPYHGVPETASLSNAAYHHEPVWYRKFYYQEEAARGLDCTEDLASPGTLTWDLSKGDAIWILSAEGVAGSLSDQRVTAEALFDQFRKAEFARRQQFASRLHRAADAYIVQRKTGKTIVAGYPWFTDWGRDTFIALRGLCLATGRLDEARQILMAWTPAISDGMVPNRFVEHGDAPEFNSVDASLWYVVAVGEFLQAMKAAGKMLGLAERAALHAAIEAILSGYARGTRYGIRVDDDGLLACGERGVQLTWMDAKVGDWVVTPRIGKPVEVQALWANALSVGSETSPQWRPILDSCRQAFSRRFWNEAGGCLYDVIDVDHQPGTTDASFRPNQVFAVGGLPLSLLEGERARQVVDAVEARLWTPVGLRTLAPDDPAYKPRCEGTKLQRDGAYHQGTVWPWLLGPFVEAWVRVRGSTPAAKQDARQRFVAPLLAHLDDAGLGHVSEISDGDPPHTPRGCPFQAWSVGELLRLTQIVLSAEHGIPSPHAARTRKAAGSRQTSRTVGRRE
jgi:predicted glycogen debranching enzyme